MCIRKLLGVIASEVNDRSIRTVDAQLNLAISNRTLMIRGNVKLFGLADSKRLKSISKVKRFQVCSNAEFEITKFRLRVATFSDT